MSDKNYSMDILYNNKFVNDLAWVIYSTSLIKKEDFKNNYTSEECYQLFIDHKEWLTYIDENIKLYKEETTLKNYLLGKYFEQLLTFFFKHSPYFDLIVSNEQIIINKETKGEVDFVVYNKKLNQFEHIEVAIKYYMYTDKHKSSKWVGPNSNDYYENKISNLISHQLKILKKYKSHLPQLNDINNIVSKAWMKGYFLEKNITNDFIYLQEENLETYFNTVTSYYEIQKLDWLNPKYYHPKKVSYNTNLIGFKKQIKERLILSPMRPISFNTLSHKNKLQTVIVLNDGWPMF